MRAERRSETDLLVNEDGLKLVGEVLHARFDIDQDARDTLVLLLVSLALAAGIRQVALELRHAWCDGRDRRAARGRAGRGA